jgi:hypothetical protein
MLSIRIFARITLVGLTALATLAGCGMGDGGRSSDTTAGIETTSQALTSAWTGCRGQGNWVCTTEKGVNATYFYDHPSCLPNTTCAGQLYACWSQCPFPQGSEIGGSVGWGKSFTQGESLYSANGKYRMTWQTDSNLVVYRVSDGAALWDAHTNGSGANQLIYQTDGNLVMYRPGSRSCYDVLGRPCDPANTSTICRCKLGSPQAVWDTATNGAPAESYLVMQNDNNLVMYSPTGGVEWAYR